MTKLEWDRSSNVEQMVTYLRSLDPSRISSRQIRLWCVQVLHELFKVANFPELKPLRAILDKFDHAATFSEYNPTKLLELLDSLEPLRGVHHKLKGRAKWLWRVMICGLGEPLEPDVVEDITQAAYYVVGAKPIRNATHLHWNKPGMLIRHKMAELLREIVGNPFEWIDFNPRWREWNNSTIPNLAHKILESKSFDQMPILADAFEEAGCDDRTILDHCRSSKSHIRGCWVLDLARNA
ncbi:MAG: hypothetical protein ACFCD0_13685 [Gemmataceae bacterium]